MLACSYLPTFPSLLEIVSSFYDQEENSGALCTAQFAIRISPGTRSCIKNEKFCCRFLLTAFRPCCTAMAWLWVWLGIFAAVSRQAPRTCRLHFCLDAAYCIVIPPPCDATQRPCNVRQLSLGQRQFWHWTPLLQRATPDLLQGQPPNSHDIPPGGAMLWWASERSTAVQIPSVLSFTG